MFVHPQGCTHPHRPPCPSVHLHGFGAFSCVGVVICLNVFWGQLPYTTPIWGCLPLNYTPTLHCWFPVHCYSQGYWYHMWAFPFLLKGLGVFPHHLGRLGGTSALCLSTCSFLYYITIFFVVHYVSHFDHGSNYYSSSYSGIFWPVISVISDSGSFPDRVSSKPWHGSTTTLDTEGLWRCSWLHFCATAANSIFNSSSGLCQLCYGFSTGRFLFQS